MFWTLYRTTQGPGKSLQSKFSTLESCVGYLFPQGGSPQMNSVSIHCHEMNHQTQLLNIYYNKTCTQCHNLLCRVCSNNVCKERICCFEADIEIEYSDAFFVFS